jgi:transcriptional regulator with XRE-family HTH domain
MPKKPKYKLKSIAYDKNTIGERIAKIRKEKGLTQKELADKIGISRSLLANYECGWTRLFGDMIAGFAIALEVSTDEILGLKNIDKNQKKK